MNLPLAIAPETLTPVATEHALPLERWSRERLSAESFVQLDVVPTYGLPERHVLRMPAGHTLLEFAEALGMPPDLDAHMLLDGVHKVERRHWHAVRPKRGMTVHVLASPRGGNQTLALVATIAVVALSAWVTGGASLALLGGSGALITSSSVAAAAGLAISVAGMYAINTMLPPAQPKTEQQKRRELYLAEGTQNAGKPWGMIPWHVGKQRVIPDKAGVDYTTRSGDDVVLHALLCGGEGPARISDIKIASTPITEYRDIQVEILSGWDSDPQPTLYTGDRQEMVVGATITKKDGWITRRTEEPCTNLAVDILFPQGIWRTNSKGEVQSNGVGFTIQYRRVGVATWTTLEGVGIERTKRQSPFLKSYEANSITPGLYDVRVNRISDDDDGDDEDAKRQHRQLQWNKLRSWKPGLPVKAKGLVLVALRAKSSDRVSGMLDQVSWMQESICPDYEHTTGEWPWRVTRNPSSLIRRALTSRSNPKPKADADLILPDFVALHDWCRLNSITFDESLADESETVESVVSRIAEAARARVKRSFTRYGLYIDRPGLTPVTVISPRNAWGIKASGGAIDLPKAVKIRWRDAASDYQVNEDHLFFDGHTSATAGRISNVLDLVGKGIDNWRDACRMAYWRRAEAEWRAESFEATQDAEYRVADRGEVVSFSDPASLIGQTAGRVLSVETESRGRVRYLTLDVELEMEAGKSYELVVRTPTRAKGSYGVKAVPGRHRRVELTTLPPVADSPAFDDLVVFGIGGQTTIDCLVKEITPDGEGNARLVLVPYAGNVIHAAMNGIIPPYDPFASPLTRRPDAPEIVGVRTDDGSLTMLPDGTFAASGVVSFGMPGGSLAYDLIQLRWRPFDQEARDGTGPWQYGPMIASVAIETAIGPLLAGSDYEIQAQSIISAKGQLPARTSAWGESWVHDTDQSLAPAKAPVELNAEVIPATNSDGTVSPQVKLTWVNGEDGIFDTAVAWRISRDTWSDGTVFSDGFGWEDTGSDWSRTVVGAGETNVYVVTGLQDNQEYQFQVETMTPRGRSQPLSIRHYVSTTAPAPPQMQALNVAGIIGAIAATWRRADGLNALAELWVASENNRAKATPAVLAAGDTARIEGLKAGDVRFVWGRFVSSTEPPVSGPWSHTSTSGLRVVVGTIDADDIQAGNGKFWAAEPGANASGVGLNLLPDANLETGGAIIGKYNGYSEFDIVETGGFRGPRCVRIPFRGAENFRIAMFSKMFRVKPGRTYFFGAASRVSNTSGSPKIHMGVEYRNAAGAAMQVGGRNFSSTVELTTTASWATDSGEYRIPQGVEHVHVLFWTYGGAAGSYAYFDDFEFREMPVLGEIPDAGDLAGKDEVGTSDIAVGAVSGYVAAFTEAAYTSDARWRTGQMIDFTTDVEATLKVDLSLWGYTLGSANTDPSYVDCRVLVNGAQAYRRNQIIAGPGGTRGTHNDFFLLFDRPAGSYTLELQTWGWGHQASRVSHRNLACDIRKR